MAPKNSVSGKRRGQLDEKRAQYHEEEEKSDRGTDSDSDSDSDSDPDSGGEAADEIAATKKAKSAPPQKPSVPEPVENSSACSSPSSSGFLIVPSQKPAVEKIEKKASTSKIFNHDDVIAMLKGLAVFWANGRNNKWAEFHLFIKDRLRNQFTKIQVSEKIRNLKKKFDANLERARANGGHLDLPDPRELTVFELSKALWLEDDEGIVAHNKAQMTENEEKEEKGKSAKRRKQMDENDEGSKKTKKRKQLGEENKEIGKLEHEIEELLGGDERDAANTILSLVNGQDEGDKKTRKKKREDEDDVTRELFKEGIQVDARSEVSKKKRKRKQMDELDKENNTQVQKEEHVEKKEIVKEVHQGDQHDVNEELSKEEEHVDEDEEQNVTAGKPKQEHSHEEKRDIGELEKHVDDHCKDNNKHEEEEEEIKIEDFQSAYPLLYASFDVPKCPRVAKEKCVLIAREDAQHLEEKWRELNADMLRLELKKLDFMTRGFHRLLGK